MAHLNAFAARRSLAFTPGHVDGGVASLPVIDVRVEQRASSGARS
jgi:hypothetical protein